ncbi:diguanylate cyclase (GGDEF)-like protein [Rheinheimera pacifica]|uniref:GGDEF domain-containing protein n=1 Tax=Rheinheimera pacifica TaxID=173990 RepID=UPI000CAC34AE|nr:GGDEF domain-containing protein [Rheinheimera pacifica]MDR6983408.1 diguanylate cyclase (GGDEF)-like protein [Rheinheimera pacifica]PKM21019.1 MAG: GGDEF domain-containing protein [Gammaproteobacteria bacterium HGW-Gammaproteobacteria-15]
MWRQHLYKITLTVPLLSAGLLLALSLGVVKNPLEFDWLDILGEGVVLLVALCWLSLIISSRPAGRVSEWLYYGSLLLVCSFFLDLLDEFIRYPTHIRIMSWLESLPAPVGMLALTYGLVGWHREQRIINRQLQGRELFLRDHRLLDPLTQLYGVNYLYAVLAREMALHRRQQQPLCLLMLGIDHFTAFNRQHGTAAGDDYLTKLAELITSQMRCSDVLCRYAGDRFVAVLANTNLAQADIIGLHLQQHLRLLSAAEATLTVTLVATEVSQQHAAQALQYAETQLNAVKSKAHAAVLQLS